eukprot:g1438.t1
MASLPSSAGKAVAIKAMSSELSNFSAKTEEVIDRSLARAAGKSGDSLPTSRRPTRLLCCCGASGGAMSSSFTTDVEGCDAAGWMMKRPQSKGISGAWKRRWFVLVGTTLTYRQAPAEGGTILGTISLATRRRMRIVERVGMLAEIHLSQESDEGTKCVLRPETENDLREWEIALKAAIALSKGLGEMAGWLLKKGGAQKQGRSFRHTWKRRWFILDVMSDGADPTLFYFANEKDARKQKRGVRGENALGCVSLRSATVKAEEDTEKHTNRFAIYSQDNIKYNYSCDTLRGRQRWIAAIEKAVAAASVLENEKGASMMPASGRRSEDLSLAAVALEESHKTLMLKKNSLQMRTLIARGTRQGNLWKKGGGKGKVFSRRNWKERYFELHSKFGQSILSWSAQKGGKVKGFLNLVDCSVSTNDNERKHMKGYGFEICHATRRNLCMCAESEAERSAWMRALQNGIDCANMQNMTSSNEDVRMTI